MINGYRRLMIALTYLIGVALLSVAVTSAFMTRDGLQTEEQIAGSVGLAFVSFALVQTFDRSLWDVLPPAVARLLGIYADKDEHRNPPPDPGG